MESNLSSPVKVELGSSAAFFEVEQEPIPHILVENSHKKLHGWWSGKRECTAERMLVNPFNGCTHNCSFCYARAFWGYFGLYASRGILTVFKDFDQAVADQLNSLNVASTGYLSPVTDPFQPINGVYHLSEKIMRVFVERNLPIEFITKGEISDEALHLLKLQPHSFGQVSILTVDESLRKMLVPNGASTETLFENLNRIATKGIHTVCRIDPIIPLITDSETNFTRLVRQASFAGAKHIVASCLDIPRKIAPQVIKSLSDINPQVKAYYSQLYCEEIDGYKHASISYRKRLFSKLRKLCDKMGLTFALCMEYELQRERPMGLNSQFMSSNNCEGIDIPIYVRRGERFMPAADCLGNCLSCRDALCGFPDLAMGKDGSKRDWKFEDYRRWSKKMVKGRSLEGEV